jgi:prepilin-type N-terminal cleavage/methylation domain-containing protein
MKDRSAGFTLIELLVVIAIIGTRPEFHFLYLNLTSMTLTLSVMVI